MSQSNSGTSIVSNKYRGTREYLLVYSELIRAAQYRGTVTYQHIAQIMGLPLKGSYMGSQVGWILGEISDDEQQRGRPMLSAVAVGVSGKPGSGFFALARQLGKLGKGTKEDDHAFWLKEREVVYKMWQKRFGK